MTVFYSKKYLDTRRTIYVVRISFIMCESVEQIHNLEEAKIDIMGFFL